MLTPDEAATVAKLRTCGASWREIQAALGRDYHEVRAAIDPNYRVQRRDVVNQSRRMKRAGQRRPSSAVGHMVSGAMITIPQTVLAEREARLALEPRSVTAALMGDPLPGRSALDRKHSTP